MLTPKRRRGAEDGSAALDLNTPKDGIVQKTNIVTDPNRTTSVDKQRLETAFLLKYSEGSRLTVQWYRNLKGINDIKSFFDIEVDNPTQQLELVHNLPLLVINAIDPSQQSENKSFQASGEATTPLSFPANENDFFVTSIAEGRLGLFYVTECERGSYDKEGVIRITYQLVSEFTDEHATACARSTVREFYYAHDRVGLGHTPLLTPTEWQRWLSINELVKEIEKVYVHMFYDHDTQTILIPDQERKTYDPFFLSFVKRLGFSKYPYELTTYNLDPIKPDMLITVWREIVEQTKRLRSRAIRNMELYPRSVFKRTVLNNTVYASHVGAVVMSKEHVRLDVPTVFKPSEDFTPVGYRGDELALQGLNYFEAVTMKPYVFTETYYNGGYGSVLEYGLSRMLEKQPLNQSLAVELAERVFSLPPIETAYYMPLVYSLLKYSRGLQ